MIFTDRAIIEVRSGKGGDGLIAFLREKYRPNGGPAGGNGGRGGSIYFRARAGINTLAAFRHSRLIRAEDGKRGLTKNMYGRGGKDVIVDVPLGTVVYLESDHSLIADLDEEKKTALVAKGGRGGRGNAAFKSARNRAPNIAENGLPGERKRLILELKLLADVGLLGLPNAGKSTLLSVLTRATPLIASYPFTTIRPELGAVERGGENFIIADLPGLIEGAHEGKGLGLFFLRHLERCRIIVYVIAMDGEHDPLLAYKTLKKEITAYGSYLIRRPSFIIASKMDVSGAKERLIVFKKHVRTPVLPVSSWERSGLSEVLDLMQGLLRKTPRFPLMEENAAKVRIYDAHKTEKPLFTVVREKEHFFRLSGARLERTARLINTSTDEGMLRLLAHLDKIDVESELKRRGARQGDTVALLDFEFIYSE